MTGPTENLVKEISTKRGEPKWLTQWRLDALHAWQKMREPHWAEIDYAPIDYSALNYYNKPARIDNTDLKETYEKMGLPENEQRALLGMATDTVIDSESVHTSYTAELAARGIIFLPFSDAVKQYPDLVRKYLGTVVPPTDNFFAALNSAVFSDGTFVYIPPDVECPIDLASYFRIETAKIGQFERTLIIADKNSKLSYMEGCSAPRRPNHQLHSGVVEIIVHDNAYVKYATVQNWHAGDSKKGKYNTSGILNFVTKRGKCYNNARLDWTQFEVGSAMTWKYPSTILYGDGSASDFYSLSITRQGQQSDTGTKMLHIGKNTISNIVSYGVALDWSHQTFRSLVHFLGTGGKNASKCDTRIIGTQAITNALPNIVYENTDNIQTHEAKTGAIDEKQLTYLNMAGLDTDTATALIIGSMATPILSRLPMEFLVESKQLIQMALATDGGKK
ncbi:MAG: Fe-S cluster assembly protein SufB [Alphaproteobacteria bacterium]|nr:Fe-S cluster assembly protein SufB [Alphaproteobacteria bacterium]